MRHTIPPSPIFLAIALAAAAALGGCRSASPLARRDAVGPAPSAKANASARLPVGPIYWVLDGRRLGVDSTGAIAASIQRLAPQEIQSVEVLKGRTAIERFGTEASGGVVIVTTRSAESNGS